MDNSPHNLGELCQAQLDKWEDFPVECMQRIVARMPRSLAAIMAARGGNTQSPDIYKTTPTGSIIKKIKFVWPDLPQLPFADIYVYSCSLFLQHQ